MKWLIPIVVLLILLCGNAQAFDPTGYPFQSIDVPDPWGFLTKECTSYAAWYWNAQGFNWYNTQPGRGSARYWNEIAQTLGYTVGSLPQVGSFIVWRGPLYMGDQWGYVAVVEIVNNDGTIDVSEMNWDRYSYDYRANINPGDWGQYYYIYNSVPEPSNLLALCGGTAGLLAFRRRRN